MRAILAALAAASMTLALLVLPAVLGAGSLLAKPSQVEPAQVTAAFEDMSINTGPSGAMLERQYFHEPLVPYAGQISPCRLQLKPFDKTRLAQSCK